MVKTVLPMQGVQVPSLVKELDPTCCNYVVYYLGSRIITLRTH